MALEPIVAGEAQLFAGLIPVDVVVAFVGPFQLDLNELLGGRVAIEEFAFSYIFFARHRGRDIFRAWALGPRVR